MTIFAVRDRTKCAVGRPDIIPRNIIQPIDIKVSFLSCDRIRGPEKRRANEGIGRDVVNFRSSVQGKPTPPRLIVASKLVGLSIDRCNNCSHPYGLVNSGNLAAKAVRYSIRTSRPRNQAPPSNQSHPVPLLAEPQLSSSWGTVSARPNLALRGPRVVRLDQIQWAGWTGELLWSKIRTQHRATTDVPLPVDQSISRS